MQEDGQEVRRHPGQEVRQEPKLEPSQEAGQEPGHETRVVAGHEPRQDKCTPDQQKIRVDDRLTPLKITRRSLRPQEGYAFQQCGKVFCSNDE